MANEQSSATVDQAPGAGQVFYRQPELLTVEEHGNMGLNPSAAPYAFCRSVRAVPLTSVEMVAAQRHYPIIFSSVEEPSLLAVVGVLDDDNLFVDDDGQWQEGAYIPAYLRCHPFALVSRTDEQFAVAVDMAAPNVAEAARQPFFDGGDLAPEIQARVDHCLRFDAQAKATAGFCQRLVEHGLLTGHELSLAPDGGGEEVVVARYVAVDFRKLESLDAQTLCELHRDGTLASIYAHRFSLDLWHQLLARRSGRRSGT